MNKEQDIIKSVLQHLPRSTSHLNNFFESDSEVISYNNKKLLFSLDEFSQEDYFRDKAPYCLGWNVAVCTLSDIFASGGRPLFFAHSMVVNPAIWDQAYINSFSKGVGDALKAANCAFIGGDTGTSEKWHYTGVAIGESDKPITRKGAQEGDSIYMTGVVGAGNLEAAFKLYSDHKLLSTLLKQYKVQFPLRMEEAKLINEFASSCIDTSDGTFNALNTVAEINNTGFALDNIPYLKEGVLACKLLRKPKTLLFLGECGEYELLFTVKKEDEQRFIAKSKDMKLCFNKLGIIKPTQTKTLNSGGKAIDLNDFNIQARNYTDIKQYLNDLSKYAQKL